MFQTAEANRINHEILFLEIGFEFERFWRIQSLKGVEEKPDFAE